MGALNPERDGKAAKYAAKRQQEEEREGYWITPRRWTIDKFREQHGLDPRPGSTVKKKTIKNRDEGAQNGPTDNEATSFIEEEVEGEAGDSEGWSFSDYISNGKEKFMDYIVGDIREAKGYVTYPDNGVGSDDSPKAPIEEKPRVKKRGKGSKKSRKQEKSRRKTKDEKVIDITPPVSNSDAPPPTPVQHMMLEPESFQARSVTDGESSLYRDYLTSEDVVALPGAPGIRSGRGQGRGRGTGRGRGRGGASRGAIGLGPPNQIVPVNHLVNIPGLQPGPLGVGGQGQIQQAPNQGAANLGANAPFLPVSTPMNMHDGFLNRMLDIAEFELGKHFGPEMTSGLISSILVTSAFLVFVLANKGFRRWGPAFSRSGPGSPETTLNSNIDVWSPGKGNPYKKKRKAPVTQSQYYRWLRRGAWKELKVGPGKWSTTGSNLFSSAMENLTPDEMRARDKAKRKTEMEYMCNLREDSQPVDDEICRAARPDLIKKMIKPIPLYPKLADLEFVDKWNSDKTFTPPARFQEELRRLKSATDLFETGTSNEKTSTGVGQDPTATDYPSSSQLPPLKAKIRVWVDWAMDKSSSLLDKASEQISWTPSNTTTDATSSRPSNNIKSEAIAKSGSESTSLTTQRKEESAKVDSSTQPPAASTKGKDKTPKPTEPKVDSQRLHKYPQNVLKTKPSHWSEEDWARYVRPPKDMYWCPDPDIGKCRGFANGKEETLANLNEVGDIFKYFDSIVKTQKAKLTTSIFGGLFGLGGISESESSVVTVTPTATTVTVTKTVSVATSTALVDNALEIPYLFSERVWQQWERFTPYAEAGWEFADLNLWKLWDLIKSFHWTLMDLLESIIRVISATVGWLMSPIITAWEYFEPYVSSFCELFTTGPLIWVGYVYKYFTQACTYLYPDWMNSNEAGQIFTFLFFPSWNQTLDYIMSVKLIRACSQKAELLLNIGIFAIWFFQLQVATNVLWPFLYSCLEFVFLSIFHLVGNRTSKGYMRMFARISQTPELRSPCDPSTEFFSNERTCARLQLKYWWADIELWSASCRFVPRLVWTPNKRNHPKSLIPWMWSVYKRIWKGEVRIARDFWRYIRWGGIRENGFWKTVGYMVDRLYTDMIENALDLSRTIINTTCCLIPVCFYVPLMLVSWALGSVCPRNVLWIGKWTQRLWGYQDWVWFVRRNRGLMWIPRQQGRWNVILFRWSSWRFRTVSSTTTSSPGDARRRYGRPSSAGGSGPSGGGGGNGGGGGGIGSISGLWAQSSPSTATGSSMGNWNQSVLNQLPGDSDSETDRRAGIEDGLLQTMIIAAEITLILDRIAETQVNTGVPPAIDPSVQQTEAAQAEQNRIQNAWDNLSSEQQMSRRDKWNTLEDLRTRFRSHLAQINQFQNENMDQTAFDFERSADFRAAELQISHHYRRRVRPLIQRMLEYRNTHAPQGDGRSFVENWMMDLNWDTSVQTTLADSQTLPQLPGGRFASRPEVDGRETQNEEDVDDFYDDTDNNLGEGWGTQSQGDWRRAVTKCFSQYDLSNHSPLPCSNERLDELHTTSSRDALTRPVGIAANSMLATVYLSSGIQKTAGQVHYRFSQWYHRNFGQQEASDPRVGLEDQSSSTQENGEAAPAPPPPPSRYVRNFNSHPLEAMFPSNHPVPAYQGSREQDVATRSWPPGLPTKATRPLPGRPTLLPSNALGTDSLTTPRMPRPDELPFPGSKTYISKPGEGTRPPPPPKPKPGNDSRPNEGGGPGGGDPNDGDSDQGGGGGAGAIGGAGRPDAAPKESMLPVPPEKLSYEESVAGNSRSGQRARRCNHFLQQVLNIWNTEQEFLTNQSQIAVDRGEAPEPEDERQARQEIEAQLRSATEESIWNYFYALYESLRAAKEDLVSATQLYDQGNSDLTPKVKEKAGYESKMKEIQNEGSALEERLKEMMSRQDLLGSTPDEQKEQASRKEKIRELLVSQDQTNEHIIRVDSDIKIIQAKINANEKKSNLLNGEINHHQGCIDYMRRTHPHLLRNLTGNEPWTLPTTGTSLDEYDEVSKESKAGGEAATSSTKATDTTSGEKNTTAATVDDKPAPETSQSPEKEGAAAAETERRRREAEENAHNAAREIEKLKKEVEEGERMKTAKEKQEKEELERRKATKEENEKIEREAKAAKEKREEKERDNKHRFEENRKKLAEFKDETAQIRANHQGLQSMRPSPESMGSQTSDLMRQYDLAIDTVQTAIDRTAQAHQYWQKLNTETRLEVEKYKKLQAAIMQRTSTIRALETDYFKIKETQSTDFPEAIAQRRKLDDTRRQQASDQAQCKTTKEKMESLGQESEIARGSMINQIDSTVSLIRSVRDMQHRAVQILTPRPTTDETEASLYQETPGPTGTSMGTEKEPTTTDATGGDGQAPIIPGPTSSEDAPPPSYSTGGLENVTPSTTNTSEPEVSATGIGLSSAGTPSTTLGGQVGATQPRVPLTNVIPPINTTPMAPPGFGSPLTPTTPSTPLSGLPGTPPSHPRAVPQPPTRKRAFGSMDGFLRQCDNEFLSSGRVPSSLRPPAPRPPLPPMTGPQTSSTSGASMGTQSPFGGSPFGTASVPPGPQMHGTPGTQTSSSGIGGIGSAAPMGQGTSSTGLTPAGPREPEDSVMQGTTALGTEPVDLNSLIYTTPRARELLAAQSRPQQHFGFQMGPPSSDAAGTGSFIQPLIAGGLRPIGAPQPAPLNPPSDLVFPPAASTYPAAFPTAPAVPGSSANIGGGFMHPSSYPLPTALQGTPTAGQLTAEYQLAHARAAVEEQPLPRPADPKLRYTIDLDMFTMANEKISREKRHRGVADLVRPYPQYHLGVPPESVQPDHWDFERRQIRRRYMNYYNIREPDKAPENSPERHAQMQKSIRVRLLLGLALGGESQKYWCEHKEFRESLDPKTPIGKRTRGGEPKLHFEERSDLKNDPRYTHKIRGWLRERFPNSRFNEAPPWVDPNDWDTSKGKFKRGLGSNTRNRLDGKKWTVLEEQLLNETFGFGYSSLRLEEKMRYKTTSPRIKQLSEIARRYLRWTGFKRSFPMHGVYGSHWWAAEGCVRDDLRDRYQLDGTIGLTDADEIYLSERFNVLPSERYRNSVAGARVPDRAPWDPRTTLVPERVPPQDPIHDSDEDLDDDNDGQGSDDDMDDAGGGNNDEDADDSDDSPSGFSDQEMGSGGADSNDEMGDADDDEGGRTDEPSGGNPTPQGAGRTRATGISKLPATDKLKKGEGEAPSDKSSVSVTSGQNGKENTPKTSTEKPASTEKPKPPPPSKPKLPAPGVKGTASNKPSTSSDDKATARLQEKNSSKKGTDPSKSESPSTVVKLAMGKKKLSLTGSKSEVKSPAFSEVKGVKNLTSTEEAANNDENKPPTVAGGNKVQAMPSRFQGDRGQGSSGQT